LLLIYGFDLINLASETPIPRDLNNNFSTNYALRFAIVTIFWLSIAAGQYLFKILFYFRFIKNPLTLFIDNCSLANISLLILTESNYGYYIHGESVHPFADANMKEFNEYLHKERLNTVVSRGLIPDSSVSPVQTFEVFVPHEFRKSYNQKLNDAIAHEEIRLRNEYSPWIDQENKQTSNSAERNVNTQDRNSNLYMDEQIFNRFYKIIDLGLNPQRTKLHSSSLFDAYYNLNEYLKHTINEVKLKHDQVLEKQLFHRLGLIPDHRLSQKIYFYNDRVTYSFTNVLAIGFELKTLIFNIVLFGLVDVGANNPFASVIVVYFVNIIIRLLKDFLFKRNICKKTLLDERFLN
jgi:meckelin